VGGRIRKRNPIRKKDSERRRQKVGRRTEVPNRFGWEGGQRSKADLLGDTR